MTLSRGRAPRPRAAASAEAPASPTCITSIVSNVMAGSAPVPSPAASRCTPSGSAAPAELSQRTSFSSAGSTEPSVPSVARSAAERSFLYKSTVFASRYCRLVVSLQLLQQRLRRLPQLIAGAAEVYGGARLEHVAQLGEEDALLVTAQREERHVAARRGAARWVKKTALSGATRSPRGRLEEAGTGAGAGGE
eukprot:scaffold67720_cov63-Phaeocystis_antarctica.AAC.3